MCLTIEVRSTVRHGHSGSTGSEECCLTIEVRSTVTTVVSSAVRCRRDEECCQTWWYYY